MDAHGGLAELDVSGAGKESLQKHWGIVEQEGENEVEEAEAEEEEEHPDLWFLCDGCKTPIPGGKRFFESTVMENFTLCMKCFRIRRHPGKFIRRRVPESCTPPEDVKGMQFGADDAAKSMDEYFQLDYEDIIGGDLPTRFKYRKVEADDFGIPAHVVLSKSGKELNQMVSLKKLRPYRDEDEEKSSQGKGKKDGWKSKGRGKGQRQAKDASNKQNSRSKGPKKEKAGDDAEALSSARFKAYNLEGDKFAGKSGQKWKKQKAWT